MTIQLINGKYSKNEALSIITKLIEVKIDFQQEKIRMIDNEEDIKMRENRIKYLQHQLSDFRQLIFEGSETVTLTSDILLN